MGGSGSQAESHDADWCGHQKDTPRASWEPKVGWKWGVVGGAGERLAREVTAGVRV